MIPFVQDADFLLLNADVLDGLRSLPDESVHCVVTSPPYWGLRDYGTPGQLGLEATPDEYVARMVAVFREVRRVLRSDGTCWLNLGDSYAGGGGFSPTAPSTATSKSGRHGTIGGLKQGGVPVVSGLKAKDLVGIPWMVAFALRADGWYLRADIVWSKPNPMPESVTDRPTKAHEYVFLLTRSPRYFFDQEAVRERYTDGPGLTGGAYNPPGQSPHSNARGPDGRRATRVVGADGSIQHRNGERWPNGGRNVRSVWEIATQPYPEAHFATYPEELVRRCIAAGSSERGCCPECGKPWEREVRVEPGQIDRIRNVGGRTDGYTTTRRPPGATDADMATKRTTLGWRPGCGCERVDVVPATCLDPFMGSGTTAHVARRLGRRSVGIELNSDYCKLAARRMQQQSLFATEVA